MKKDKQMKKDKPSNKQIDSLKEFYFNDAPLFELGATDSQANGATLQEILSAKDERYFVVSICPIWCPPCQQFSKKIIPAWVGNIDNVGFAEIIVEGNTFENGSFNYGTEDDATQWDQVYGLSDKGVNLLHIDGIEGTRNEILKSLIEPLSYYGRSSGTSFSYPTSFVFDTETNKIVSAITGYAETWTQDLGPIVDSTISLYEADQNGELLSSLYEPLNVDSDGILYAQPLSRLGLDPTLDYTKTTLFFGPSIDVGNGADILSSIISGEPKKILLGNGDDLSFGSVGVDEIWGGNGDDTITGLFGNDYVDAGRGNDKVLASLNYFSGDGIANYNLGKGNDTFYLPLTNFSIDGSIRSNVGDFDPLNDVVVVANKFLNDSIPSDDVSSISSIFELAENGIAGEKNGSAFIGDTVFYGVDLEQLLGSTSIDPNPLGVF